MATTTLNVLQRFHWGKSRPLPTGNTGYSKRNLPCSSNHSTVVLQLRDASNQSLHNCYVEMSKQEGLLGDCFFHIFTFICNYVCFYACMLVCMYVMYVCM